MYLEKSEISILFESFSICFLDPKAKTECLVDLWLCQEAITVGVIVEAPAKVPSIRGA